MLCRNRSDATFYVELHLTTPRVSEGTRGKSLHRSCRYRLLRQRLYRMDAHIHLESGAKAGRKGAPWVTSRAIPSLDLWPLVLLKPHRTKVHN